MVSDHVAFSSSSFPVEPGEDQETNPGVYGKALASWVAARLRSRGVAIDGVIAEDFGRCVVVTRTPVLLFIAVASDDEQATRWQMYIAAEQRPLRKLFWPANPEPVLGRLREHFRAIVAEIPGARDVEWQ